MRESESEGEMWVQGWSFDIHRGPGLICRDQGEWRGKERVTEGELGALWVMGFSKRQSERRIRDRDNETGR